MKQLQRLVLAGWSMSLAAGAALPPGLILMGLFGINLALRWVRLDLPPLPAFDEVYYRAFADDLLQSRPFFDAHPPLGKYWIALSLYIWNTLPTGLSDAAMGGAIGYRWLNATVGAAVPLLGGWVAWEGSGPVSRRRRQGFRLLATTLLSLDGLLLVESRLALLHVALVAFGLLGVAAWMRSRTGTHPPPWRLLAGLALGASVSVKWNGAGYLLGLWLSEAWLGWRDRPAGTPSPRRPWLWLGIVPVVTYSLTWLPYLALTETSLITMHQQLWQFHQQATATHPYQSAWFTWPLMTRPIAYFYQGWVGDEPLGIGPPTPLPQTAIALYGMNNPFLTWLATAAIGLMGLHGLVRVGVALRSRPWSGPRPLGSPAPVTARWLLLLYLSHWLPWAWVGRTTFFYHYLPAALMAELGLAWLMSRWLTSDRPSWRCLGWSLLGLILAGFWFWLPLWIGWPLSMDALQQRWWLPAWR